MKTNPSIRRRSPLRRGIEKGRTSPSASQVLALLTDGLERAMPDMAQIGVGMLVLVACVACGWIDLGMDEKSMLALQQAQEAVAADITGYASF